MGETGDDGGPVILFELVELAAVDEPRNDFADVEGPTRIQWNHALKILCGVEGLARFAHREPHFLHAIEIGDNAACNRQSMHVVNGVVIGNA